MWFMVLASDLNNFVLTPLVCSYRIQHAWEGHVKPVLCLFDTSEPSLWWKLKENNYILARIMLLENSSLASHPNELVCLWIPMGSINGCKINQRWTRLTRHETIHRTKAFNVGISSARIVSTEDAKNGMQTKKKPKVAQRLIADLCDLV